MAHIQTNVLKLWKPQSLTVDKIDPQRMFIDNINELDGFALSILKRSEIPVASLTELKAINTSNSDIYITGMIVMVKSNGLYFFDRTSTATDNGNTIIMPTTGGGRWISHKTFFGNLAFKDSLTKADIGLSNVPNVSTNDQTPTYTQATTLTNLVSGEKLSIAMGKIAKAIVDLGSHLVNKMNPHGVTATQVGLDNVDNTSDMNKPVSIAQATAIADAKKAGTDTQINLSMHMNAKNNPHGVTATQVGLGNVPNVSTNNQTPTYTQATTLTNLVSGEKLSISMGKIMKAITDLISHLVDKSTNPHSVTKAQVGLGNVNNTSDLNKPISTATQTALDGKAPAKLISGYTEVNSWNAMNTFIDNTLMNDMTNNSIKHIAILLTADIGPFYHSGSVHFTIHRINADYGYVIASKYSNSPNEVKFYSRCKASGGWGDWTAYQTTSAIASNVVVEAEVEAE